MLLLFRRRRRSREPLYRRLDRAADEINPFLMVIAIGLAVLDICCLVALLDTGSLGLRHPDAQPAVAGPVAVGAPGN
jgi:hypothetical protein